jgi:gamma-glutamyl-gamma-aminobutyrate hydrolase PuuD
MNIGLTQRILHYNDIAYDCIEHGWYNLLNGHTLFYIPNKVDQDYVNLVSNLDFVIFTGGDASPHRVLVETRILTQCYLQYKPVLGVCHGAFFINELEQGVNDTIDGHVKTEHDITLEGENYTVNSHHNIWLKELGNDLTPIAYAHDNSIEGFRHKKRLLWGLAWHPERMQNSVLPNELKRILSL